jgi:hypothetical protein
MQTNPRRSARKGTQAVDRLAWAALVLAAGSAFVGLVVPGVYRDADAWVRQARAADLVTLVAVVPVLTLSLIRARSGSDAGRMVALAAVGYLVYNYAIFGFSVAINPMTPVHIAVLGLAVWTISLAIFDAGGVRLTVELGERLPRRTSGAFLVAVGGLFGLMWLGQIAGAITTGTMPEALAAVGLSTNPVYTLDLAIALPFLILAGTLLLQRRPAGRLLAVIALPWTALMGLGVLAIFVFDAMSGADVPVPVAAVIGAITGIGTVLAGVGLQPARTRAATSLAAA